MWRTLAIGTLLALLGLPAGPASAFLFDPARVDSPWCLAHSDRSGIVECSFYTFEQCQETRLGVGGSCQPNYNTRYAIGRPQRSKRRRDR